MVKKNIQHTTYNIQSKAFTIVELLVAMTLLVILLGLSGMVFSTTVKAHRAAGATIDVTRNLRAITDQLNTDFRGLRKDAPLMLRFRSELDVSLPGDIGPRCDAVHFFADGDFQTMKQYLYDNDTTSDGIADGSKTVFANLARIYYGHANSVEAVAAGTDDFADFETLARKTNLLTVDGQIMRIYGEIPAISNWPTIPTVMNYDLFDTNFGVTPAADSTSYENVLEFNTIAITNWVNALNYLNTGVPVNADHFIANCMTNASRPQIDISDFDTLHLLLSQGVVEMKIQWAYEPADLMGPVAGFTAGVRWWPSRDPDGNGDVLDADFLASGMGQLDFGVYFGLPGGVNVDMDSDGNNDWFSVQSCRTGTVNFSPAFYPKALKFTFVLKDSNGLFPDGKTFTHIVYLDN